MRKILLLNPPGRLRYIRDQFCSHVSKGSYYWQPLDLLVLSGQLDEAGFELAVVDAIAERLSPAEALRRIEAFAPDALIFLTGSDSFAADVAFVGEARRGRPCVVVGIGDVLREQGPRLLARYPVIDACLNDFVTHGLVEYLRGHPELAGNMTVRTAGGTETVRARPAPKSFTLPLPRYDLFPLGRYHLPFNRHHPYATVVTSTWCPFGCVFCPFARTPYRWREAEDVLANFDAIDRMGIRQVHVADWTFGIDRKQTSAILDGLIAAGSRCSWSCLSRVDLVDRELLERFKRAGCDLVEFGVESGSQALLDRYEKGITIEQVRQVFRWTRELGLRTLATFVLGLPGETPASLQQTLDLALEIDPTYCSFNIASPRMATALRRQMLGAGLVADEPVAALDSSRAAPAFSTAELPAAILAAFRRRAIRRFYFRPAYLLGRAAGLGSWVEFRNLIGNGASLAWQVLTAQRGR